MPAGVSQVPASAMMPRVVIKPGNYNISINAHGTEVVDTFTYTSEHITTAATPGSDAQSGQQEQQCLRALGTSVKQKQSETYTTMNDFTIKWKRCTSKTTTEIVDSIEKSIDIISVNRPPRTQAQDVTILIGGDAGVHGNVIKKQFVSSQGDGKKTMKNTCEKSQHGSKITNSYVITSKTEKGDVTTKTVQEETVEEGVIKSEVLQQWVLFADQRFLHDQDFNRSSVISRTGLGGNKINFKHNVDCFEYLEHSTISHVYGSDVAIGGKVVVFLCMMKSCRKKKKDICDDDDPLHYFPALVVIFNDENTNHADERDFAVIPLSEISVLSAILLNDVNPNDEHSNLMSCTTGVSVFMPTGLTFIPLQLINQLYRRRGKVVENESNPTSVPAMTPLRYEDLFDCTSERQRICALWDQSWGGNAFVCENVLSCLSSAAHEEPSTKKHTENTIETIKSYKSLLRRDETVNVDNINSNLCLMLLSDGTILWLSLISDVDKKTEVTSSAAAFGRNTVTVVVHCVLRSALSEAIVSIEPIEIVRQQPQQVICLAGRNQSVLCAYPKKHTVHLPDTIFFGCGEEMCIITITVKGSPTANDPHNFFSSIRCSVRPTVQELLPVECIAITSANLECFSVFPRVRVSVLISNKRKNTTVEFIWRVGCIENDIVIAERIRCNDDPTDDACLHKKMKRKFRKKNKAKHPIFVSAPAHFQTHCIQHNHATYRITHDGCDFVYHDHDHHQDDFERLLFDPLTDTSARSLYALDLCTELFEGSLNLNRGIDEFITYPEGNIDPMNVVNSMEAQFRDCFNDENYSSNRNSNNYDGWNSSDGSDSGESGVSEEKDDIGNTPQQRANLSATDCMTVNKILPTLAALCQQSINRALGDHEAGDIRVGHEMFYAEVLSDVTFFLHQYVMQALSLIVSATPCSSIGTYSACSEGQIESIPSLAAAHGEAVYLHHVCKVVIPIIQLLTIRILPTIKSTVLSSLMPNVNLTYHSSRNDVPEEKEFDHLRKFFVALQSDQTATAATTDLLSFHKDPMAAVESFPLSDTLRVVNDHHTMFLLSTFVNGPSAPLHFLLSKGSVESLCVARRVCQSLGGFGVPVSSLDHTLLDRNRALSGCYAFDHLLAAMMVTTVSSTSKSASMRRVSSKALLSFLTTKYNNVVGIDYYRKLSPAQILGGDTILQLIEESLVHFGELYSPKMISVETTSGAPKKIFCDYFGKNSLLHTTLPHCSYYFQHFFADLACLMTGQNNGCDRKAQHTVPTGLPAVPLAIRPARARLTALEYLSGLHNLKPLDGMEGTIVSEDSGSGIAGGAGARRSMSVDEVLEFAVRSSNAVPWQSFSRNDEGPDRNSAVIDVLDWFVRQRGVAAPIVAAHQFHKHLHAIVAAAYQR